MRLAVVFLVVLASLTASACGGDDAGSPTGPTGTATTSQTSGSSGCTPPAAPSNLNVSVVATTTVLMTWTGVSNATEYLVLVGTAPSSSNTLSTNAVSTSYPWSGVPQGTHYVRIQSKNSCGTSGSSNEVRFTV